MNLSARFIARPVGTTLLAVAVAIAGAIAFGVLPVAPLPQVDFPTISVSASLPGGSAEIMASSVATPLERQFSHIAGVTEMTSASSLGSTQVTLQFDLSRDIDGAARDVEAAINASRSYLPANLPGNPTYRKVNPADSPIMILGLTSDKYAPAQMYDAASTVIEQKLSQLSGVGQVNLGGGALPAVRVDANPEQLAHYGLSLANLQTVLSAQNANLPKGQINNGDTSADILANDQIIQAADYRPLVVGYSNGSAVRLQDVADVTDDVQNSRAAGFLNGKRAVMLIIFRQPGANIIQTVDNIRASLPTIKASINSGIDITVVLDRTTTIRASVKDVERTLITSTFLVVIVVFVFLRNLRSTFIPGIAMPVSLIGTFAIMYLFGYSIDNLSLMALTIATGFVVDDAIVVMENITRHIEAGMKPVAAALLGAKEIGSTVFTISVTPMMCAHLLKNPKEEKHGRFYQLSERTFERLLAFYRRTLHWVLDHPRITLTALLCTVALNVFLVIVIPKGFFPQQDTGLLGGGVQGRQDTSFAPMEDSIRQIEAVVKADPAVANVVGFTGGGATNTGNVFTSLKPLAQRKVSAATVINRLRPKLNRLPVAQVFMQAQQDLRIGGRSSNAMYQYTIQSDNIGDLNKWGPILVAQMKKLPGFQDVNSDQQNGGLDEMLNYDRVTAARLGLTTQALDSALYSAFGQAEVSVIYKPLNYYYVVLEVAPQFYQGPEGLNALYLPSAAGGAIPLSMVAKGHPTTTALAVNHTGLFPSVTASFNLAPNVSLSQATASIGRMQARLGTPDTIHGFFAGTLQAYQQSLSSEPVLVVTALLSVFIVLGVLYESLVHPLTIISSLPPASVGAMLALLLFHEDLNVISIIGIVLLIGLVKKNAIMMIDFALQAERGGGMKTEDAIFEACMLRFRPILMTTMAALFGALPLAFGSGTGSELRRPLGIAIIGGLIVSQMLTLYTTPVVYLYMDRFSVWWASRHPHTVPTGAQLT